MAVRDGVVAWLGSDDVGRAQFPDASIVDLDGAFVAPAFVDSHVHVTDTGLTLTGLDLRPARSLEHCLQLIADYARTHPDGPVWAHGWDESDWPRAVAPTTDDIDAAVGNRCAYLTRVDVHSAAASTALRQLISDLANRAGYHPQNPLSSDAHHDVRAFARDLLTRVQRAAARRAALDTAASLGVVAVHECAGPTIGGLTDWTELRDTEHGVDVVGFWGEAVTTADEAKALVEQIQARGLAGDLFVDGALGSRTAWLAEPYADANHCGNRYLEVDDMAAHVQACTDVGVAAGFHVIGDAAVSAAVDAFAGVVDRYGVAAVARCGHRLEHVEMITPEQAARLGSWGVIASVQPNFDAKWGGPSGMYAQRLGAERGRQLNPFSLLASNGVPLAFGSDAPVTTMNPWVTVRAAAHHRTQGSGVSARAAFAAATRGGWRAAGVRDVVTGTLVPGAVASYAVWATGQLAANSPQDAVQQWSTDPRSRVPLLPRLDPGKPLPECVRTVHRGEVIYG
jgi:predicted amidohydrolase YtcJ